MINNILDIYFVVGGCYGQTKQKYVLELWSSIFFQTGFDWTVYLNFDQWPKWPMNMDLYKTPCEIDQGSFRPKVIAQTHQRVLTRLADPCATKLVGDDQA